MTPILQIKNLTISTQDQKLVDDISFDLHSGKVLALVGESGSGKTLTALSVLDLLPEGLARDSGEILFNGNNIFDLDREGKRDLRGNRIGMVFQEPFTALNPVMRVGTQISEALIAHKICPKNKIEGRVAELLDMVKLTSGTQTQYPHELSGGMRQRIVLAMALACDPDILMLDEPTTALDVSIQKEILDLIVKIQEEENFAVLFITHDFSVVNMLAHEVCVMRNGIIVEKGTKDKILKTPTHPYTKHLINCIPRMGDKRKRLPVGKNEMTE